MTRVQMTAAAAGAALVLGLSACGGGEDGIVAVSDETPKQFDVYVWGQEAGPKGDDPDPALYGLTLNPLRVYKVATAQPVEAVAASPTAVVVELGDGKAVHLGLLGADGTIGDIPGLGQPKAHSPQFLIGGRLRYTENTKPYRYVEFDLATKRRTIVQTSKGEMFGVSAGPDGSRVEELGDSTDTYALRVVTARKTYKHKMPGRIGTVVSGVDYIAVGVDRDGSRAEDDGPAVQLVDPVKGAVFGDGFDGWEPVSWSADGKSLLVRNADARRGDKVELGLVFVTGAAALREVGSIPWLYFEKGSWVRGLPAVCDESNLCTSKDPSEL